MTNEQKHELIAFLKTQESDETMQGINFRFLGFRYTPERIMKDWIFIEQGDKAPFEAIVHVGQYTILMTDTVESIIRMLESGNTVR